MWDGIAVTTWPPKWMTRAGLEWVFRLLSEPRRLWKRYLIGNFVFLAAVVRNRRT